jgi:hypothetical protein
LFARSGRLVRGVVATSVCLALAACGTEKSSNPLSPSVAGPIAGVTITAPKPLEPSNGAEIKTGTTVTLRLENASSNSQRPFWHQLEVATDSAFASKVVSADKINPGSDGRVSYTIAAGLTTGQVYYWRARAVDGANTGPYSATASFRVVDPVTIAAPGLVSPANGETLATTTPTLVARNTAVTGSAGAITLRFEVAADGGFTQMIAIWSTGRSGGDTTSVQGSALTAGQTYYWRVQATNGTITSAYSAPQSFKTPAPIVEPPPTGGGGGPTTPPPTGGGGGSWPHSGEEVVAWAIRTYPDRLAPTSSGGRRANMEFLRDRMIEAGICGGMQLAWNLKRGGPELSVDYFTWNSNGRWVGVDIAHDYDNAGKSLQLTWAPMPDDPYATYGGYTNPLPCR